LELNLIIAENLKRLRNERNLSLGQLSELCAISKVMLSQIEKGNTNPTINTIWKIAGGLNVPYTSLLEKQEQETVYIKKIDLPVQNSAEENYKLYCYYQNTPRRNFELFQMELKENSSYTSIGHSEKSSEYIMVIKGELELQIEGETFILKEDDSLNFNASAKHIYSNKHNFPVKAIIINFYPA